MPEVHAIKFYVQHHGLVFPRGELFPFYPDNAAMIGYLVSEPANRRKATLKQVEDRLVEALTICHSNAHLMQGKGRWATNFWVAVRRQVSWLHGIDIRRLEEFLLILAEAARCGMHITDPVSTVAQWARLFARDIQEIESQLGISSEEPLTALRGMEHDDRGRFIGTPMRVFPIWAFGKNSGVPLNHI